MKNFAYLKSQSASEVDWSKIKHFKQEEFPLDELGLLNRYVIEELDKVREALGVPIIISPVEGAVIRHDDFGKHVNKKSYHYFDHETGRLGQAIDVFLCSLIPFVSPIQLIMRVLGCSRFRGLGMYFDTILDGEPKLMLHLDLRHEPLVWVGKRMNQHRRRTYFYPSSTSEFMTMMDAGFQELKLKDISDDELCLRPRGIPEDHEE